ncbi:MAG: hypothetical protein KIT14_14025 [bacterium]|nr:hypothetical protein [bacterium]
MTTYRVPLATDSAEDAEREEHADLDRMGLDDLEHELCRVVVALAAIDRRDPARPWLLERLRRVRAAIRELNTEIATARRARPGVARRTDRYDRLRSTGS